jgi:PKD repeat protein
MELNRIIRTSALAAALALVTLLARANERHDPGNPNYPKLTLQGIQHGQAAIDALGEHLPVIAQSYGHTPEELRGMLISDHTLHVDESGRLIYLDEPLPDSTTTLAASAPYPLANTFLLHSRPGAKRLIYLDFDGHVLTGTAWNSTYSSITCPAWDIDGNPSSFGDNERTIIQGIWQRVSEDYRPFDLDVTTEYPGEAAMTRTDSLDDLYGVRVLISPISSYFGAYGGIAYVGVFDYTGDYYKPALIFPENLANNEKYIAEAASHEAGHTLGLSHDGTTTGSAYYSGSGSGETGWAPIMGVGYYENLSQWSKGEYANANNKEDDLAVMQSNGIAYRADDYGNTISTAKALPIGTTLNISGVIERNTDIDVFSFVTGAGSISITVSPAPNGANLDVQAQLYSASGSLMATGNPTGVLAASLNLSVTAGTYYLFVRGTGQGDPLTGYSSYASLGAYTVSGTVVATTSSVPPIAVPGATPTSGTAPLVVQFNGSSSSDPDGTISSYLWTFGDGTSATGVTASHTYSAAGTYTAILKVTDNSGLSSSGTVGINVTAALVNTPPTALVTATPVSGSAPLVVQFNGTQSYDTGGSISSYLWTFGDGGSATGSTTSHTYNSAGSYTATLKVTDNGGLTATKSVVITVSAPTTNLAPRAVATATPTSGYAPLTVTLNGAGSNDSDGSIASYQWTFGDGATGTGASVSHVYQSTGTYTAVLTVRDNLGATGSTSVSISALAPVSSVMHVGAITLSSTFWSAWGNATAVVNVLDGNNKVVPGATVTGTWSGPVTGTFSGTTDTSGNARFTSGNLKKGTTVTFTVNSVSKGGYTYDVSHSITRKSLAL